MKSTKTSKLFITFSDIKRITLVSGKEYSLHAGDILIYIIYLPDFFEFKSNLSQFLNAPEIKKAKRFYKEIDKNRFIIYRSILKLLLGAYTKSDVKNLSRL